MSWGRVLSSAGAVVAVAGAAVVAVGMSRTAGPGHAEATPFVMPSLTRAPYTAPAPTLTLAAVASAIVGTPKPSTTAAPSIRPVTTAAPSTVSIPARTAPRPTAVPARPDPAPTAPAPSPKPSPKTSTPAPRPVTTGVALPLRYATGSATRVITVVARSAGSTVATLQAWDKAPGGGWLRHGSPVTAHLGADGLSSTPSESRSATPIGSFTLTQAFGYYGNPGTGLPYLKTTSADWWISQAGPLYNTHQRCSSGCGFSLGAPNEHLMYETPYYNYAVVIDYNTRNSPTGVRQGAGSAFFLHVTDGSATAGCISIPQSNLVSIMRWLVPSTHPRILIGVA